VDSDDGEDAILGSGTEEDGTRGREGVGVGSSDDVVDSDKGEDMIGEGTILDCGTGEDGMGTEGAAGSG
jgi:hypothetical protein